MLIELAGGFAVLWVIEDLREPSLQLPRGEEEGPIDEPAEGLERRLDDAEAREGRRGDVAGAPVDRGAVRDRQSVGEERRPLPLGVLGTEPVLELEVLGRQRPPALGVQERRDDAYDPGRVEHVHDGLLVPGGDPHRRVLA